MKKVLIPSVALAVVLSASLGMSHAYEQSAPPERASMAHGEKGMPRHGMPMPDMTERLERQLERVNATPEQKEKIKAIHQATMTDLKPLHEKHQGLREKGMALLTQAKIDRAALEQNRAEQNKLMEQIGKRMTQSLADGAEVLTPEQRAQMAENHTKRERERK